MLGFLIVTAGSPPRKKAQTTAELVTALKHVPSSLAARPCEQLLSLLLFLPPNETALMIGVPRQHSNIDREEITRLVPQWVWKYE